jgi:hypothetical protein
MFSEPLCLLGDGPHYFTDELAMPIKEFQTLSFGDKIAK